MSNPKRVNVKLPSFQFYPGDWRKDPGVQSLTYHDRGVWLEILCMMHESEQRGRLLLNGVALPDDALARLLGLDRQVLSNTLSTLLALGVASRDPATGALMNRRMVRDEAARVATRERVKRHRERNAGCNGYVTPPPEDEDEDEGSSSREREPEGKPRSKFMPSSEQEAVEWASMAGVPADFAKEVFHQIEGRGGVDGSGQPVTNWRSHIAYRWSRQRHEWKPDGKKPERAMTPHDIKTVIAAKEAIANELKAKFSSEVAMGVTWDNEVKRDEWRVIKREIKELTVRLSQMV